MADRTLRSAAVMAAGTVLSRLLGFVRIALLAAAIGTALRGDIFTAANTIPNSLYILLAGGVFNTVLVPQLVRAIKNHEDGGQDFTNRLLTFGFVVLAVVTVGCVLLAPQIAGLYLPDELHEPSRAAERASMIMFVQLCLPQIFFYGAFVLVGQVLNARRRFGPMMWAPIANNLVACAAIVVFLLIYRTGDNPATYSTNEELLLGLGHTVGIAVQLLVLLPYLRASGHHYRPKFGLRGTGLGRTAKLGLWTVLFVAVNQVTLVVVTNLAIAGSASPDPGAKAGLFAYSTAMLIILVPHGIVTVSLATAAMPQLSSLAADGDVTEVARLSAQSIRQALAIVVPAAAAMVAFAYPIVTVIAGYGSGKNNLSLMAYTLMALALGLVPFTVQYFQLRSFYAFEDTRTPFFLQCAIAALNITAALVGVRVLLDEEHLRFSGVALGAAYSLTYLFAVLLSRRALARKVPRVHGAGVGLPLLAMIIAAVVGAGLGRIVLSLVNAQLDWSGPVAAVLQLGIGAVVMLPVYVGLARVLRIHEVTDVVSMVTAKLPGRRRRS
ncbi:integral membrane protein MviN [Kribbella flavida DSM 17836]|uniref:Integral membrane protein MviN n=1 Tax=Kribbella flavida (strain DSM 17836 / JCM 10339 / NBRC 14399) TaxID=479435 RepID=D2Q535_KRIFD|nr:murein biosynthesis integral membrane protein MurJ [Kribbella flavida]ADB36046.1 integral membrane protein MviN [Kribbella flavida DSM 17836]